MEIIVGAGGALLAMAVIGILALSRTAITVRRDSRTVHRWLSAHTRDEPGESHRSTSQIAAGTQLTESRTEAACRHDDRIIQSAKQPDLWSIWRQEPESVYDRRGVLVF
jgi:hypothetical protein